MRKIEGILCDLDGTVCDSEWAHVQAWEKTIREYGCELDQGWDLDYVGKPDDYAAKVIRARCPGLPEPDVLLRKRHGIYRKLIAEQPERVRYPGVEEGLGALAALGYKLAVGTNSPLENTIAALRVAGIDRFFPVIVAYGMTKNGKPAPDIYLEAAARLGVRASACAVVEDTPVGIAAGKAGGCVVVAVTTTNERSALSDAHVIVDTPKAAMKWIADHGKGILL